LIFILTDYNNFNFKRLEAAYRQLLTAPKEVVIDRIIKYILDNGLFNDVSDEVQAAVISLINDAFMDKIKRYMETKIQVLRIGQSADVIATQTPKSASSGVAPTPPTPSQKRIITEAEILGTQTAKGPTPRRSPPISAEQQLATQTAKYLPSAQPYIAPPPKVSAAEQLATQTSKGTPSQKRVITEAEMLGAQTPKGPTPRRGLTAAEAIAAQTSKFLPSAQPYIAPPPSQKRVLTEAEILGTQTPKGPTPRRGPSAAEAIAAQTAKSPPKGKTPTAAEAVASQTSKAPPKA
jgi:hypothetical protein